jgi:nucleoside-diphosphate-sugar epimerase
MNILIAGHKGFIGNKVKEVLENNGHQVWRFDRDSSIKYGPICHCDIFINCAGEVKDEDKMIEDNLIFASRIAYACKIFNKRLIHLGSIVERTKDDLYSNTKKAATNLILGMARGGANFCVASPATVFGPGDHSSSFIESMVQACIKGDKYPLYGDSRDWIYIDDLAEAILKIVESDKTRNTCFEIGYGKPFGNVSVYETISSIIGGKEPNYKTIYTGKTWYADTVAINDLGWTPKVGMIAGLRKYIEAREFKGAWIGAEASS